MYLLFASVLTLLLTSSVYAQAGTLPAQLDWTNPLDLTDGVQVEKGASLTGPFVSIRQLPAASTTFTDLTNSAGTTACYRLAYFNTSGVGPYAGPVCKTFPAVPSQAPATPTVK